MTVPEGAWLVFEETAEDPDPRADWGWALTADGDWYHRRGGPFEDEPKRRFDAAHMEAIRAALAEIDLDAPSDAPNDEHAVLRRLTVFDDGAERTLVAPRADERLASLLAAVDAAVSARR